MCPTKALGMKRTDFKMAPPVPTCSSGHPKDLSTHYLHAYNSQDRLSTPSSHVPQETRLTGPDLATLHLESHMVHMDCWVKPSACLCFWALHHMTSFPHLSCIIPFLHYLGSLLSIPKLSPVRWLPSLPDPLTSVITLNTLACLLLS